jgi:hypothetical protein
MMAITLDVWPFGMAQIQYRLDQSTAMHDCLPQVRNDVNGTAVTLR